MGTFVDFKCRFCGYAETDIGLGRGKSEFPFLGLYVCANCNTFGSTWIFETQTPRCSVCYHAEIMILPDETRRVTCPKCGETAVITPKETTWE